MKSLLVGIKNVLLWSYARGTWQYDVLCGLIVLTLLVWPTSKPNRATAAATSAAQANTAPETASNVPSQADGMFEREVEWQTLRAFLQEQGKLELLNSPREAVVLFLQNEAKEAVMLVALEPFGDAQGRRGYRVRYRAN
jgi:hypothetical protein